ncbi:MAG TPA: phage holin family protein [Thauera sp.]|nr:phage holin family protein [Thauera sp.]
MSHKKNNVGHTWRFFRSGGFDQVRIESVEDLRHLGELDQKLWSVLACPTSGLEFDTRTLQLLDTDGDGRIRAPEVIAAANWVCAVLKTPDVLFRGVDGLPLDAIATDHPEGGKLAATARKVLAYMGKPEADAISVADISDPSRLFAPDHYNGDGIVPAELTTDAGLAKTIGLIIEHFGAIDDRSGKPGIDQDRVSAFFAAAQAVVDWHDQAAANPDAVLPLGEGTAAAAAVFDAVREKVEDYFTRCRLAAFDERAAAALNPADTTYAELALQALATDTEGLAALPLAQVGSGRPLPLNEALNPAWEARIAALRDTVVRPVLGERAELTQAEWQDISARFDAYRGWWAARPATPVAAAASDELRALLGGSTQAELDALIQQDLAAETAAAQVDALERLVRYNRDLVTLLRNFVTLSDFYSEGNKAIFQAGTLYLDQRSCELSLRVSDMGRHAALAPLSGAYLVYCDCVRQGEAPMTIVAAMTGGDADEMMVPGRNGVFYDRQGRDWNASVVKVVEAPISVRQAFWSPYKRIGRMIGEQIQKFAASRDKAVEARAAAGVADAGAKVDAPAAAPVAQAFDIAKFAGIFAAIGLALGALGTALAAVVTGFLSLPGWQMPLVVAGIVLLISGPSMLLAWLKLRQRNLGPLLDANGWAVNTRARINIPFGGALTGVATLPAGATRSMSDPYAEKGTPWGSWMLLLIVVVIAIVLWRQGMYDSFLG